MVELRSQTVQRRQPAAAEIQPADDDNAVAVVDDANTARDVAPADPRDVLLSRELLLRQSILTSGVWLIFIGFGAYLNTGYRPFKVEIPLVWFDYIMRRVGPALPLPALVIRWYASLPPPNAERARWGPPLLPLVAVYAAVTVARLALYFVHMALAPLLLAIQDDQAHPHFLSDHIFLGDWTSVRELSASNTGASLVAIFNAEAHMLTGQLRHPWPGMTRMDRRIIVTALLLTVVLFVLTAAENHYTARFFHGSWESFWAAVLGVLLFQVPTACCVNWLS